MTEKKEPSELATISIIFSAVFILSFVIYGAIFAKKNEARQHSREAQRCQVAGEELDCAQHTAWWHGDDECSCALDGGRRIRFTLDQGE